MSVIDLTGLRFGRLLVISRSSNSRRGLSRWRCACECGNRTIVQSGNLRTGHTQSCGCFHKERASAAKTIHGGRYTPEYRVWSQMHGRCTQKKRKCFKNYGGRGISVCERWNNFQNFLADMGMRPSPKHSIERNDNDGNYSPNNCRWATAKEQGRNKRTSRRFNIGGKMMTLGEAREKYKAFGISYKVIHQRITRDGWPIISALTVPQGNRP
jgi:hypothetical protein